MGQKRDKRRQQVRLKRTDRKAPPWQRLYDRFGLIPPAIALLLFAAVTAISLLGSHGRDFIVGQRTTNPIYADVDFSVQDEQQTLRKRDAARAATPDHFRINQELISTIASDLQSLYQAAQAAETFDDFAKATSEQGLPADDHAFEALRSYVSQGSTAPLERKIDQLKLSLRSEFTWLPDSIKVRTPKSTAEIILVHHEKDGEASSRPREVGRLDPLPISNTIRIQRAAKELSGRFPEDLRATVEQILVKRLSESPTLVYDLSLTTAAMTERTDTVEAVTIHYKSGEPVIPPRRDKGLTPSDLELIAAHDAAYRAFLQTEVDEARALRKRNLLQNVGAAAILFIATAGLFIYVAMYEPRVLEKKARLVGMAALIFLAVGSARFIDTRNVIQSLLFGPALFAASILAVVYTRRFAAGVMAFAAVMIVLCVRGDAAMLITLAVGIAATVFLLSEIRTRTRLLTVGAVSAAVVFITSMSFGLVDEQAPMFAARRATWAAVGALLSAMLVQTTLPLIENVFSIATSLTLLEWRDPTRPLLQRLAEEAPGTNAHSLLLGTLAEAACRTIGANELLTQVGALYHDIGKIHKAEYFAENQQAYINRHDKLSPSMSLLIIIGHVKDGIEMAKEYKLPRVLHQFIAEHHGTTVVRYFHHLASEKQPQIASGKHDREVPEASFRYPGPKPRSKESAILMLCDSIEGATRALPERTPGRIETLVHQIVTDRLSDGQFDDCDITLRELHRVEESLVKSLCSHYHGRVAYPKAGDSPKQSDNKPEEQEAAQKSIAG